MTQNHVDFVTRLISDELLFSELSTICQLTTEFHFPSMEEQLEKIRDDVKEAVAWRQAHHKDTNDLPVLLIFIYLFIYSVIIFHLSHGY